MSHQPCAALVRHRLDIAQTKRDVAAAETVWRDRFAQLGKAPVARIVSELARAEVNGSALSADAHYYDLEWKRVSKLATKIAASGAKPKAPEPEPLGIVAALQLAAAKAPPAAPVDDDDDDDDEPEDVQKARRLAQRHLAGQRGRSAKITTTPPDLAGFDEASVNDGAAFRIGAGTR